MKHLTIGTILLFTVFAGAAHGQGKVTWANGFPKPGPKEGQFSVSASVTADKGWAIKTSYVQYWQKGSGPIKTSGGIGGNLINYVATGTSGVEYNVLVATVFTLDGLTVTVFSDPRVSKAQ